MIDEEKLYNSIMGTIESVYNDSEEEQRKKIILLMWNLVKSLLANIMVNSSLTIDELLLELKERVVQQMQGSIFTD